MKLISLFTNNSLLIFVPGSYKRVAACVAMKLTYPCPTMVMTPVDGWIVATDVLLDEYTIVASLLLVGATVILKGASVSILPVGTVNVDCEIVFVAKTLAMMEPAINQMDLLPYEITWTVALVAAFFTRPPSV